MRLLKKSNDERRFYGIDVRRSCEAWD